MQIRLCYSRQGQLERDDKNNGNLIYIYVNQVKGLSKSEIKQIPVN